MSLHVLSCPSPFFMALGITTVTNFLEGLNAVKGIHEKKKCLFNMKNKEKSIPSKRKHNECM